jgi:hypothetical protein
MAQETSDRDRSDAGGRRLVGGGIEATKAVAAVREGRAGAKAPTLPARGRSVRAANGFYANSFYIVSAV